MRFTQRGGRLRAFRQAVDTTQPLAAIQVDNRWVTLDPALLRVETPGRGSVDDPERVRQSLRELARRGAHVEIGMLGKGVDARLHWLCAGNTRLVPPTPGELATGGWRQLRRWLPWTIVTWIAMIICGIYSYAGFMWLIATCLLMLPVIVLTVFSTIACSLLWDAHGSMARRRSWRAFHHYRNGQSASRVPASDHPGHAIETEPATVAPHAAQMATPSPFRIVSGTATNITVRAAEAGSSGVAPAPNGTMYYNNRIKFKQYDFRIGNRSCTLYAGDDFGWQDLFLAEGDRVNVVVADNDVTRSAPTSMVWGLCNLEDGQRYLCHHVMAPAARKFRRPLIGKLRMTCMTPRYCRAIVKLMLLMVWPVFVLITGWVDWIGYAAVGAALSWQFLLAGVALVPALAFLLLLFHGLLQIKWHLGLRGRAKRLTDAVKRLLTPGATRSNATTWVEL